MKGRINYKNILLLITLLGAGSLAAWAAWKGTERVQLPARQERDSLVQVLPDPALLKKMQQASAYIDPSGREYFISGTLSMTNGADTADRIDQAEYLFTRSGDSFYYRLGETETINSEGLNVFVDRQNRRIMVSPQKSIEAANPIAQSSQLLKGLAEEGYELKSSSQGQNQTLSLLNERHLACKEYALTFNASTLKPGRLYLRLTDPVSDIAENDRIVDLRITETGKFTRKDKFAWSSIVTVSGNEIEKTAAYKNYELIVL